MTFIPEHFIPSSELRIGMKVKLIIPLIYNQIYNQNGVSGFYSVGHKFYIADRVRGATSYRLQLFDRETGCYLDDVPEYYVRRTYL